MRPSPAAVRATIALAAALGLIDALVAVAQADGAAATPPASTRQPAATPAIALDAPPPIRPFNGRDLAGWDGDTKHWTAEDGAIVGRSTKDNPLATSTYLVWGGKMPDDFELRARVRIEGGNGGIQYRSHRVNGQTDMAGFQMDLDAQDAYTGVLYEGLGRGLMSARGEQVEWSPAGKRVIAQFAPDARLKPVIRHGDWNEFRIEARGTRVRHWINGTLMSDVTDGDASRFRRGGQVGLQLHAGPPMEVRWTDIEVRPITSAPPPSALIVPEGFKVDLLTSAQAGQGSWVCLAFDHHQRAIISPQSGPLMVASIPGVSKQPDGTPFSGADVAVAPLGGDLGGAQGVCVLGDDLFVNVSQGGQEKNGLWRLRDTKKDGTYADRTKLFAWPGDGGEHGPHGVVPGPDGMLYLAIGNHVPMLPAVVREQPDADGRRAPGSPVDFWAEDLIVPRMWDPRGHAVGITAPGGIVYRVDPKTGAATIFADGFRNHYDLAFNKDGELFTYDSDMEWDIGAPWYRAPRVVHVVQGADYGWRSGSGKWPERYEDSLPPACDTDAASPTGMLSGHEGPFPEPWHDAIFACDWTYGRVLAVRLEPEGSGYRATWQPFVTGRPMPVTDLAWGPDGAMYMTTGGRGTQSGLYRISWTGRACGTTVAGPADAAAARGARRAIEAMQRATPAPDAADRATLVAALASADRMTANAARVALEHRPVAAWRDAALAAPPHAAMRGAIAIARRGSDADAALALKRIEDVLDDAEGHDRDTTLAALRAAQLCLLRHPALAKDAALAAIAGHAVRLGAGADAAVAEDALALCCALDRGDAVPVALDRLDRATDRAGAMRWATMLRTVNDGWTDDLRARYWRWLDAANDQSGGFSLGGFLENVRRDAAEHVKRPAGAGTPTPGPAQAAAPATRPIAPTGATLHAWTVAELSDADPAGPAPDLANGARIFRESTCILCHRFGGEGGSTGPDLSGVGGRFARADLLRAVLEPSADVSDQYRDRAIETKDGSVVVGRIVNDTADFIEVATNPVGHERERVAKAEIAKIEVIPTSTMPKGLLDARTRREVEDLLAYLARGPRGG